MQIDFHHTVIYVLCRIAGMKSNYAEIVAYASQQVDDATYGHALKFKNGGVFRQTRTAHRKLSRRLIDVSDAFEVWLPFHFLPQGEGDNIGEALITAPVAKSTELLKRDLIDSAGKPYGLHRLGIGLHVYADTFSHQDFKGYYDSHNDISLISGMEKRSFVGLVRNWLVNRLSFLPPIGHGQALKNPDIPYAKWSYQRHGEGIISVRNLEDRYIPAMKEIYRFLRDYIEKNSEYSSGVESKEYETYENKLINLLKHEGDSRERHRYWLGRIHENYFDFPDFDQIDATIEYDPRLWFRTAVEAIKAKSINEKIETWAYNFYNFNKRTGFAESNWVKFMRAAAIHKYRILHEILPACGLNIG